MNRLTAGRAIGGGSIFVCDVTIFNLFDCDVCKVLILRIPILIPIAVTVTATIRILNAARPARSLGDAAELILYAND